MWRPWTSCMAHPLHLAEWQLETLSSSKRRERGGWIGQSGGNFNPLVVNEFIHLHTSSFTEELHSFFDQGSSPVSLALFLRGWTRLTPQGVMWKEVGRDTSLSTLRYSFKNLTLTTRSKLGSKTAYKRAHTESTPEKSVENLLRFTQNRSSSFYK